MLNKNIQRKISTQELKSTQYLLTYVWRNQQVSIARKSVKLSYLLFREVAKRGPHENVVNINEYATHTYTFARQIECTAKKKLRMEHTERED